jgi:hypothetical protein
MNKQQTTTRGYLSIGNAAQQPESLMTRHFQWPLMRPYVEFPNTRTKLDHYKVSIMIYL